MFLTFPNKSKTEHFEHFEHFEHSEHFMHSVHIEHFEHLGSRLTVSAPTEPQKGAGGLVNIVINFKCLEYIIFNFFVPCNSPVYNYWL